MPPLISLLTDFGTRDPWVAICKGVILTIAPDARLLDISHEIDAFDVVGGALTLADALPELPVGTHLAVVDPGVGTARRAIAIRTGRGDTLVGPDNGLLLPAAERLGGVVLARELRDPRYRRAAVSHTFHGRDVFAPAAGHLAAGVALELFGPAVRAEELVPLDLPRPEVIGSILQTTALLIDSFGNVSLAGSARDLERALGPLRAGDELILEWWAGDDSTRRRVATWAETFAGASPGEAVVFEDSLGRLAIAINQGDAAAELGIAIEATVNVLRDR